MSKPRKAKRKAPAAPPPVAPSPSAAPETPPVPEPEADDAPEISGPERARIAADVASTVNEDLAGLGIEVQSFGTFEVQGDGSIVHHEAGSISLDERGPFVRPPSDDGGWNDTTAAQFASRAGVPIPDPGQPFAKSDTWDGKPVKDPGPCPGGPDRVCCPECDHTLGTCSGCGALPPETVMIGDRKVLRGSAEHLRAEASKAERAGDDAAAGRLYARADQLDADPRLAKLSADLAAHEAAGDAATGELFAHLKASADADTTPIEGSHTGEISRVAVAPEPYPDVVIFDDAGERIGISTPPDDPQVKVWTGSNVPAKDAAEAVAQAVQIMRAEDASAPDTPKVRPCNTTAIRYCEIRTSREPDRGATREDRMRALRVGSKMLPGGWGFVFRDGSAATLIPENGSGERAAGWISPMMAHADEATAIAWLKTALGKLAGEPL